MIAAAAALAFACVILLVLLLGRHRGAMREERRLTRVAQDENKRANDTAMQLAKEQAKVRHLQERNADLRDELDIATGSVEPSLVAEMTAFLADITPEDFR